MLINGQRLKKTIILVFRVYIFFTVKEFVQMVFEPHDPIIW